MNFYQENYYSSHDEEAVNFNSTSMLGRVPSPKLQKENDYDPDFDSEVKNLLEELDEDLLNDGPTQAGKEDEKSFHGPVDPKKEQYEDYYDEFSEEEEFEEPPTWYDALVCILSKIKLKVMEEMEINMKRYFYIKTV